MFLSEALDSFDTFLDLFHRRRIRDPNKAFRSEPGSTVLFGADEPAKVARVLGALRTRLGHDLGLVEPDAVRA